MKIRVVQLSWQDNDCSGFNSFLFKEKSTALSYAQQLLDEEYDQRELSEEYFKCKNKMFIDYLEPGFGEYFFTIQVEQKKVI